METNLPLKYRSHLYNNFYKDDKKNLINKKNLSHDRKNITPDGQEVAVVVPQIRYIPDWLLHKYESIK